MIDGIDDLLTPDEIAKMIDGHKWSPYRTTQTCQICGIKKIIDYESFPPNIYYSYLTADGMLNVTSEPECKHD